MSLALPAPVHEAIAVTYKIDSRAGAVAQHLVGGLWGDVDRVERVAIEWERGADAAQESIGQLRQEIRTVAGEHFWAGPAKDSYQQWVESLIEQTLAPVLQGLEETQQALGESAKTIAEMRVTVVKLCVSFTGAVASLIGSASGPGAAVGVPALVGFGAWFVGELINLRNSYINALDGQTEEMRAIRDKTIGTEETRKLDPAYPVPVTEEVITPPLNKSVLGDWDNWENENPKIEQP